MKNLKALASGIFVIIISYINKDIDVNCMEAEAKTSSAELDVREKSKKIRDVRAAYENREEDQSSDERLEKRIRPRKTIETTRAIAGVGALNNGIYVPKIKEELLSSELGSSDEEELKTMLPTPPKNIPIENSSERVEALTKEQIIVSMKNHLAKAREALEASEKHYKSANPVGSESSNMIENYTKQENLTARLLETEKNIANVNTAVLEIENYSESIKEISETSVLPTLAECSKTFESVSSDMRKNSIKLYEAWQKSVFNNKLLGGALLVGVSAASKVGIY